MSGSLKRLMTTKVGLASPGSGNRYGDDTPGSYTYYDARIVDKAKMVRDKEGREVVSERQVFVLGNVDNITPEWAVELPSTFSPRYPPIINVARVPTRRGDHHMEIQV